MAEFQLVLFYPSAEWKTYVREINGDWVIDVSDKYTIRKIGVTYNDDNLRDFGARYSSGGQLLRGESWKDMILFSFLKQIPVWVSQYTRDPEQKINCLAAGPVRLNLWIIGKVTAKPIICKDDVGLLVGKTLRLQNKFPAKFK